MLLERPSLSSTVSLLANISVTVDLTMDPLALLPLLHMACAQESYIHTTGGTRPSQCTAPHSLPLSHTTTSRPSRLRRMRLCEQPPQSLCRPTKQHMHDPIRRSSLRCPAYQRQLGEAGILIRQTLLQTSTIHMANQHGQLCGSEQIRQTSRKSPFIALLFLQHQSRQASSSYLQPTTSVRLIATTSQKTLPLAWKALLLKLKELLLKRAGHLL